MKVKFDFKDNRVDMDVLYSALQEVCDEIRSEHDLEVLNMSVNITLTDGSGGYYPDIYGDDQDGRPTVLEYVVKPEPYARKTKNTKLWKQLETVDESTGEIIPGAYIYEKYVKERRW